MFGANLENKRNYPEKLDVMIANYSGSIIYVSPANQRCNTLLLAMPDGSFCRTSK